MEDISRKLRITLRLLKVRINSYKNFGLQFYIQVISIPSRLQFKGNSNFYKFETQVLITFFLRLNVRVW